MNLKHKVIALIVSLLLGISTITSFINYRINIKREQNQLRNIALPLSIDNIYTEVQKRMIEPLLVSSLMANNTFMKDWALNGEKNINEISKYLKKIQNKYNIFTTFFVSNFTYHYYHPKGLIDTINKNNSKDQWYFNFKNKKDIYEINLDYNKKISNALIMFINYKVMGYTNNLIGVTGVGVKLFDIEKMLNLFKKKYHYNVYFLDKSGEITLFSKSLNKRGDIGNIEGLKDFKKTILAKKKFEFEYKNRDGKYLVSTKYIKKLKLYLMVEVNQKEYINEFKNTLLLNILVSFLVTIFITLIIIYIINIYQKKLEKQADIDILTNLYNRRKFNEVFTNLFELFYRKNIKKLTLIMIDIDNFKKINDSFGHLLGDNALRRIAFLLKKSRRKSDVVARWGGEEFIILLVDVEKNEAEKIAEKLRLSIKEDAKLFSMLDRPLTISLGLAELTSKDSEDGLISKADEALYEAKNRGKDQFVFA